MNGSKSLLLVNTSDEPDLPLEPETYAITKVCFIVCIIVTSMHLLLITTNSLLRKLYGLSLCVTLYVMLASYIGTMCVCSILYKPLTGVIVNLITNSLILTIHSSIFIGLVQDSFVLYSRRYSHSQSTNKRYKYLCCEATGNVIFPILFVISYVHFNIQSSSDNDASFGAFLLPKNEVFCGVGSTHVVNAILFSTIFVMFLLEIVLIVVNVRKFMCLTGECALMASLRDMRSRLAMHIKLIFTNSLTWIIAYFAVEFNVTSMWHIFTLCCSLQSIFLAISFIFSRPVLDILHGGDQSKGIGGLALNKGILYAAVPRLKLRNNITNKESA